MSPTSSRRPLRSLRQAPQKTHDGRSENIDAGTDVAEPSRPAVHHAMKPGEFFWLACHRRAVLIAHSREKAIPEDPALVDSGPFEDLPFRALHRLGEHPLRALYEDVLFPRIAAIVQQSGLPWSTFGVYRQGWSPKAEGSVPTLAVWCETMRRPDNDILRDAERMADKLDDMLSQHGLQDVHVEVAALYWPGRVGIAYNSSDDNDDQGTSLDLAIYHPFLPGNSVGPQGSTGSGTFSGYVRLQRGSALVQGHGAGPEADIFGLVCHHVAAWGQEDLLQALTISDDIRLNSPAAADHAKMVKKNQKTLEAKSRTIAKWEAEKEERAIIEKPWTDFLQGRLQSVKAQLQLTQDMLNYINACWQTEAVLGRVLVSSGTRIPTTGESLDDWALVMLNQAKQQDGTNRPPLDVLLQYCQMAQTICGRCGIKELPESTLQLLVDVDTCGHHNDDTLPTVAELIALARQREKPTHVVLRGRSTPFGIGVLHDMRDGVRVKYRQTEMVSRELTALDVPRRSIYDSHVLSRVGDSGAPVRTTDGRLVGFVLSSYQKDQEGKATTHIAVAETVAKSIQRATGAENVTFVGRDEAVKV